jgi:hypothetical protein
MNGGQSSGNIVINNNVGGGKAEAKSNSGAKAKEAKSFVQQKDYVVPVIVAPPVVQEIHPVAVASPIGGSNNKNTVIN